jgi:putative membrane protein
MIVYLLLAEAQATLLSAMLTFSDRVIYSAYAAGAGLPGLTPLEDQALAGVIMWVPGSIAFTVPVLWLVLQSLGPQARSPARAAAATTTATATNGSTATSAGQRS